MVINPYSGNHERDWPGTGSFYGNMDSGGDVVCWLRICFMSLLTTGPNSGTEILLPFKFD
jgi:hypothetical protein